MELLVGSRKFSTLEQVLKCVLPGDLIEFDRDLYSHYALYMGNGKVMNVCAEDKNLTSARIAEMPLEQVCGTSALRINNHDDIARRRFGLDRKPVKEILKAARSYEGTIVEYEFTGKNCEFYTTLWRFGRGFSTQVTQLETLGSPTTVGVVADLTSATQKTSEWFRWAKQKSTDAVDAFVSYWPPPTTSISKSQTLPQLRK